MTNGRNGNSGDNGSNDKEQLKRSENDKGSNDAGKR